MNDTLTDLSAKFAINVITKVFKTALDGLKKADGWFKEQKIKNDFFGGIDIHICK